MKKIISFILSFILVFSLFCVGFVKADEVQTSGKCGENINWYYDESTATLSLVGNGEMYDYGYGSNNTIEWRNINIENVIISDGITYIGAYAFDSVRKIKTITFGKDVKVLGKSSFSNSQFIEKLVFPNNIEIIGEGAFYNCTNLKSITFSSGLVSIETAAFDTCESLKTVQFEYGVKTIRKYAFNQCLKLNTLTIPNSVETIEDIAFGYNYDWDTNHDTSKAKPVKNFVLVAEYGSTAQEYAFEHGINYDEIDCCENHNFGKEKVAVKKICTKQSGLNYKQCKNCNSRRFTFVSKSHTFKKNSTKIIRKATFFKNGIKTKYCIYCKKDIRFKTHKYINQALVKRKVYKNKVVFKLTTRQKGVTHYEVQIVKENMNFKTAKKSTVAIDKKIVFDNLKKGTNYEYRKRLVVKKNGKTAKGNWTYSSLTTKKQ